MNYTPNLNRRETQTMNLTGTYYYYFAIETLNRTSNLYLNVTIHTIIHLKRNPVIHHTKKNRNSS